MRGLKIALYLIAIIVLQTVVFARLNFLGVVPDLILVSVIIFSVKDKWQSATIFAGAAGFLQDVLATGPYINTIIKVLVCTIINHIKESLWGEEYSMIAGLVVSFTPLLLIIEMIVLKRPFDPAHLLFHIFLGTLYNLIFVPILLPIIRKVLHD